jgi:LPXTG-site transpeptidase (sortase) family protein
VKRALLAALLAAVVLTACGGAETAAPAPSPPVPAQPVPPPVAPPPPPPAPPAAPDEVAAPVRIEIPSIDVDAEIVPVGLADDGSMEVPDFGLAAWYTEGPEPGAKGPAVVVAHVDSRSGPDVFYRLKDLQAGDQITITRQDGSVGSWTVASQEQVDKDELPTDRIWNDTDQPLLRLITCGGIFDRGIGHYEDNIIVYADPVA